MSAVTIKRRYTETIERVTIDVTPESAFALAYLIGQTTGHDDELSSVYQELSDALGESYTIPDRDVRARHRTECVDTEKLVAIARQKLAQRVGS
jgi:hypothetical protein